MTQQTKQTGSGKGLRFLNTLILLVALVAVIVFLNLISTVLFGRLDLTDNNVNSLSPQSVEVLATLVGGEGASPLEVRVYVSAELPDSIKGEWGQELVLRGVAQKFRDKIEEFRTAAEDRVEVVEVAGDVEKKAEEAGVEPFVAEEATVKEGKLEMTRYVLGCTFHYEGEVEVLPKALDPNFFEFEITKRLLRLKDRVENGRKIQHLIAAADAIYEAVDKCTQEVTAFEVKEEEKEKQEMSGIEGLLKPIENMEEEAKALAKNKDRIIEKCADVEKLVESKGLKWKGEHKRFDAFLKGTGPEGGKGGLEGYVEVVHRLTEAFNAENPDVQQIMEFKRLLVALKTDAEDFRNMLKKAPGQQKIGFVCGHGEFCPFPSDKPVIDPKIAGMMGQQNPIHQRFLDVAVQIQEQVNQIMAGIGNGLFTDKDFEIMRVEAAQTIPDEVAALVLFAPREKLSDRERYVIDQFVMRGGTLLVFVDNYNVSLASFSEEEVKKMGPFNPNPKISNDFFALEATSSNLDELLSPYGIVVNKDLILDPVNNNKVSLPHSVRRGQLVIRGTKDFDYPMLVQAKEFDRANVIVRNLPVLTLPFASSLEYEAKEGNEVEVSKLVQSDPLSVAVMDPASLAVAKEGEAAGQGVKLLPPELMEQTKSLAANGPHTLALSVTGKLTSAFKGKEAPPKPPEEEKPDEEGMPPRPKKDKKEREEERLETGSGRIVVVGSGLGIAPLTLQGVFKDVGVQEITQGEIMIPQVRLENWKIKLNQVRRVFGETIPAMFNIFDWAVQRAALAEIRAKNNAYRPIEKMEEGDQKLVTYGAIGGLPILFILFGLGYWQVRVARSRSLSRRGQAASRRASPPPPPSAPVPNA